MEGFNVAVVGVGAVGEEMLNVLEQRHFPVKNIKVLARSAREIKVNGKAYQVRETKPEEFDDVDIALFAGTENASKDYGWEAAKRGAIVIDNSATFRMDPNCPLVVPECNPDDVDWHKGVIANPNCSTHSDGRRAEASSEALEDYSHRCNDVSGRVSGTGRDAIDELDQQSLLASHVQKR